MGPDCLHSGVKRTIHSLTWLPSSTTRRRCSQRLWVPRSSLISSLWTRPPTRNHRQQVFHVVRGGALEVHVVREHGGYPDDGVCGGDDERRRRRPVAHSSAARAEHRQACAGVEVGAGTGI
ncbi:hypothetical protein HYPSUDRAFT_893124 [Hypholoma sublateritium FD-334 SS-4]|uniref:Uncharacterized protein n=1 Tax=Hypholoma sublateritium (strain FD-334 SS-4) TaxID=945553 RepID=A0A0D2PHH9_HYPSF|nr:hypothetical protein HYPSUDRAFT_893124 [Hypholoma sublateritium FD-334 SS-4]